MKGTISISHKGHIVQQLTFKSIWNRDNIIAKWKKMYGKGYESAEVIQTMAMEPKRVKSRYEK